MAHTYTQQDGHRQTFANIGDFLGELVRRSTRDDVRLPVIIDADIDGLHVTELVCIDMPPAMPVGIAGAIAFGG